MKLEIQNTHVDNSISHALLHRVLPIGIGITDYKNVLGARFNVTCIHHNIARVLSKLLPLNILIILCCELSTFIYTTYAFHGIVPGIVILINFQV